MRGRRLVPWLLLAGLGGLALAAALIGSSRSTEPAPVGFAGVKPNPGAYLIPPGTKFSVNANRWTVGQQVTMTGNHCPISEGITASFAGRTSDTPFVRQPDGTWSVTVTVPAGAWGPTLISAQCGTVGAGPPLFTYPQDYSVFIASPYTLAVVPDQTFHPGATLAVSPTMSFCSSIDSVTVGINVKPLHGPFVEADSGWLVPPVLASPDVSTSGFTPNVLWHADLTLPTSAAAGNYFVVAECGYARGVPGIFAPHQISLVDAS